jgi:hypothetical protein
VLSETKHPVQCTSLIAPGLPNKALYYQGVSVGTSLALVLEIYLSQNREIKSSMRIVPVEIEIALTLQLALYSCH